MIRLKSPDQIQGMRRAGEVVDEAHRRACRLVVAGVTTREIDAEIERVFTERGADPLLRGFPGRVPFPAVSCVSVNDEAVHAIPSTRKLVDGDLVTIDTACRLDGWCADAAWSWGVGPVSAASQQLLRAGEGALSTAVEQLGHCRHWSDVAAMVSRNVERNGGKLVEWLGGHGIGCVPHEDPGLNWAVTRESDFEIETGLVLAIEPLVTFGDGRLRLEADGWMLRSGDGQPVVHFEQMVAIGSDGPEILAGRCEENSV